MKKLTYKEWKKEVVKEMNDFIYNGAYETMNESLESCMAGSSYIIEIKITKNQQAFKDGYDQYLDYEAGNEEME